MVEMAGKKAVAKRWAFRQAPTHDWWMPAESAPTISSSPLSHSIFPFFYYICFSFQREVIIQSQGEPHNSDSVSSTMVSEA